MTSTRGISIFAATVMATASAAGAADLYGGRGSLKDSPVYTPQVSGCPSWYARIDGGYSSYDTPGVVELGVDDWIRAQIDDTWSVGGGVGRYFSCNIRGDITVDYRFKSDVTGSNANPFTPLDGTRQTSLSSTVVLGNLYYDFDTGSRFRPYLGIGLGGVNNSISAGRGVASGIGGVAAAGDSIVIGGSDSWHVAGALMAGFSLQLRDRLSLDAGYRFLYLGKAETGDVILTSGAATGASAGKASIEDIHAHEVRFGLRYDIR